MTSAAYKRGYVAATQNALKIVCKNVHGDQLLPLANAIKDQTGNGWIPCSEKLPEKEGRYLVVKDITGVGDSSYRVDIAEYGYFGKGRRKMLDFFFYDEDMYRHRYGYDYITHWMMLPEFE